MCNTYLTHLYTCLWAHAVYTHVHSLCTLITHTHMYNSFIYMGHTYILIDTHTRTLKCSCAHMYHSYTFMAYMHTIRHTHVHILVHTHMHIFMYYMHMHTCTLRAESVEEMENIAFCCENQQLHLCLCTFLEREERSAC